MKRLNDPEICICGRRSDALAVGTPKKLIWFCLDCGADRAREVLHMPQKDFDIYEKRAAAAVAEKCGLSEFTMKADELPAFVEWAVKEYGDALRKQIEGKAPF